MPYETLAEATLRLLFETPAGLAVLIALGFGAARYLPALRPPRFFAPRDAWITTRRREE